MRLKRKEVNLISLAGFYLDHSIIRNFGEYSRWQTLECNPYLIHRAFLLNFLYKKPKFPEEDNGEDWGGALFWKFY